MQRIDHHQIIMNQWSRARSIRAGRWRIDHHHHRPVNAQQQQQNHHTGGKCIWNTTSTSVVLHHEKEKENNCEAQDNIDTTSVKAIYIVSDGTGWTAEHAVRAALGQFEHCFADRDSHVHTHLYSGVSEVERLIEIIKDAAKENGILLYTLAEPTMAAAANKASKQWGVPSTNILGPIIEAIAAHLDVSPLGIPRGAPGRKLSLTEEYFKRIEAIEFTIKQDDGALPQNLHKADIVITGVSRSGKTPLSIYLAQMGYKVANVPMVMGINLPKTLFEVETDKVFGLTINPVILQTIRTTRAKNLGFNNEMMCNYSEMDNVRQELEFAGRIFAQNPSWPVIEVTGKAIEEIAAVLLRLYHDRRQKYSMPRISKRY